MEYVKNKELTTEMIRCQDASINASPLLIEMFTLIATRLSCKLYYKNPQDKEDCKSQAIMDCYRYWRSFDRSKSDNGFAYITQICKNGFAKGWRQLNPPGFAGSKVSLNNIHTL